MQQDGHRCMRMGGAKRWSCQGGDHFILPQSRGERGIEYSKERDSIPNIMAQQEGMTGCPQGVKRTGETANPIIKGGKKTVTTKGSITALYNSKSPHQENTGKRFVGPIAPTNSKKRHQGAMKHQNRAKVKHVHRDADLKRELLDKEKKKYEEKLWSK